MRQLVPRRARLWLAVAALVVCGACKVDVGVAVRLDDDGTGELRVTARLDEKAVEAIGDLDTQIALDDVRDAGWRVDGPNKNSDGTAELTVVREFANTAEARRRLEDIAGTAGPLHDFRIAQRRTFFKTSSSFAGTVDLSAGLSSFSDAALTTSFRGQPLGVSDAELERRIGEPLARVFGLQVAARLPGDVTSNAPTETGGTAVWSPKLGEQVAIDATAEQWNVGNIAAVIICALSALGLLVLALVRRSARRRPDGGYSR